MNMADTIKFADYNKTIDKSEEAIADIFGRGDEYRQISKKIDRIKRFKNHDRILSELKSLNVPQWYYELRVPLGELFHEAYSQGLSDIRLEGSLIHIG